MARRKRSMFYSPPRHRKLAEIIRIDSVPAAKKAAAKLLQMFREAKRRSRKVTIKRAVVLAANRAMAAARKRGLSHKEKVELRKVAMVYYEAAAKMKIEPRRRR